MVTWIIFAVLTAALFLGGLYNLLKKKHSDPLLFGVLFILSLVLAAGFQYLSYDIPAGSVPCGCLVYIMVALDILYYFGKMYDIPDSQITV